MGSVTTVEVSVPVRTDPGYGPSHIGTELRSTFLLKYHDGHPTFTTPAFKGVKAVTRPPL